MPTVRRRLLLPLIGLTVLVGSLIGPATANADTAPELACGNTQPGPCSQTAHYTDDVEFLTGPPPGPVSTSCPSFITDEVSLLVASGHGVEHITVNKAQDGWFTQTFTGSGSITVYPLSSVVLDSDGNVTAITGPPDPDVPVYTGKVTEWFGGSFNNKTSVVHGTQNFDLSAPGDQTLSVHARFHALWTPGTDPNGPPSRQTFSIACS